MKTPMDHDVLEKTKHGMVTMLKATDPVVKFIRQKATAVSYEPHPIRRKMIFGFEIGAATFFGGVVAGISWMRRRRSS